MTSTQVSTTSKMEPKEAAHWVAQMLKLFPQASPPTPEMVAAIVTLACQYQRQIVIRIFSPDVLPIRFAYLPSLKDIKEALDNAAAEVAGKDIEHRLIREQLEERKEYTPPKLKPLYEGPMEEIRPGDQISFKRLPEYQAFMKNKTGVTPRHWGLNEKWEDSGARPFEVKIPEEKNPFE